MLRHAKSMNAGLSSSIRFSSVRSLAESQHAGYHEQTHHQKHPQIRFQNLPRRTIRGPIGRSDGLPLRSTGSLSRAGRRRPFQKGLPDPAATVKATPMNPLTVVAAVLYSTVDIHKTATWRRMLDRSARPVGPACVVFQSRGVQGSLIRYGAACS